MYSIEVFKMRFLIHGCVAYVYDCSKNFNIPTIVKHSLTPYLHFHGWLIYVYTVHRWIFIFVLDEAYFVYNRFINHLKVSMILVPSNEYNYSNIIKKNKNNKV